MITWLPLVIVTATIAWLLYRSLQRSDEPARLAFRWVISSCLVAGTLLFLVKGVGFGGGGSMAGGFLKAILIVGSTAICGILLGILWAPSVGTCFARPLVALFDGGNQEIDPEPCYSAAVFRRNRGEYAEAIDEVQRQLDVFPGDLTGTFLLAEIQAGHLHDPQTAIQTLESWIRDWGDSSDRVPAALHRIADLHLNHRRDPISAQAALERIIGRFAGTEAAHLAAQRIAHLASAEMLAEKTEPHRIRIGRYAPRLGLQPHRNAEAQPIPAIDPAAAIAESVAHLERFPEDDEARERLARLYAEQDRAMHRAGSELERLIAQPGVSTRQIARWLNLMTDLQLHVVGDETAARTTLQRLVDRFPKSATAETARHRLAFLKLELRRDKESLPVRFGRGDRQGA